MTEQQITILDGASGPELPIVEGPGEARAVVWPGVGAHARSLHRIWLGADAATIELSHPSDAVYYVVEGSGTVEDRDADERHPLPVGAMFHIDAGTRYIVRSETPGMQLVGGPAPADESLYADLQRQGG